MTPEQRIARARSLIDDALFVQIMAEFEAAAIDRAIYAKATDDEGRRAALCDARAIRDLRQKLTAIVREANPVRRDAPA